MENGIELRRNRKFIKVIHEQERENKVEHHSPGDLKKEENVQYFISSEDGDNVIIEETSVGETSVPLIANVDSDLRLNAGCKNEDVVVNNLPANETTSSGRVAKPPKRLNL